jgi:hypothetical protein
MWALIINGTVVQIFLTKPDLHPNMLVVSATSDVAPGYTYASGVFTPPSPMQYTKAQIIAEANVFQTTLMKGGISINLGIITVECGTDVASLVLLQGAFAMATQNPSMTFSWVSSTNVTATLTSTQIITMYEAITAFIQATFTTLSAVVAAIQAGLITTQTQIQNPPSPITPWPVNS